MRSFLLVIASGVVLALGFFAYFWFQPTHKSTAPRRSVQAPPLLPPDEGQMGGVGTSTNIYLKKPDKKGDLASEYFADEAKPTRGGLIEVTNPRARFYLNAGQVLEIAGTHGTFVEDHPDKKSVDQKSQAGTPTRGRLKNVTLRLMDAGIADEDRRTVLTISMDNAAFDSENTTIYTEAIEDRQHHVLAAADQVPVTLRGVDYDFDGRGLRISWNDRDRRLAKLDVMHGERLVIKNATKFSGASTKPVAAPAPLVMAPERPIEVASAADVVVPPSPPAGDPAAAEPPAASDPASSSRSARVRARAAAAAAATQQGAPAPTTEPARARRGRPTTPPPPKFQPSTAPPLYRATFVEHVQILGLPAQQWSALSEEGRKQALAMEDLKQTPQQLQAEHFELLAVSDRMHVDFMLRPENSGATPTTVSATTQAGTAALPPTTQPITSIASAVATTGPTTKPSGRRGRGGAGATTVVAATQAAPKPPEPPMYIYWTGPLHVEPYGMQPLTPGESVVTLEGAPVIAHQQNSEIRSAKLVYRTEQRDVQADAAPNDLLTMTTKDAHGDTLVRTQSMTYTQARPEPGSNAAGVAILRGRSTASLPAQADGGKLNAAWSQQCTLTFVNLDEGKQAIDRAELRGEVKVDHPQMKLDAQELDLTFDNKPVARSTTAPLSRRRGGEAATQPAPGGFQTNLNTILATNRVHCVMTNPDKKVQTIDCDRLTVLNAPTPDGRFSPRTVNADGQVHTVDPDLDLHAGHLAMTLTPATHPTTRPANALADGAPAASQPADGGFGDKVELQSLIAHESVKVVNRKDGTVATADTLLVDRDKVDGKPTVRLVGQPFAKIVDKTSTITGPIIVLFPDGQQLSVDGAGAMHGTQQETPGSTTKRIDVVFDRSMRIDGKKNVVDAIGNVVATMTDADGSVDIAKGDTAHLILVDLAPATQPTTRPATQTAAAPTTQPVAMGDASVTASALPPATRSSRRGAPTTATVDVGSPMGHKGVRQAIFQDNAEVSSTLLDVDGNLLRRMHVLSTMIQYDVNQAGAVAQKKVTIPVPGRMLVEDYRPPATQPAGGAGNGGARGATAFKWDKSLVYDDATKLMVMRGGVIIDHRDTGPQGNSMRLTGDVVNAELEDLPPVKSAKPTTGPATRAAPTEPRYQIKRITAAGNLVLDAKGGQLTADTMEYDPVKHVMIARGGARPAVFSRTSSGPNGNRPMEADEMQWDTLSELPTITKAHGRAGK